MRLSLLTLLLVSASTPVLAQSEPTPQEVPEVQPAPRAEQPRFERRADSPRDSLRPQTFEPRARRTDAPAPTFERRQRRAESEQPAPGVSVRTEQPAFERPASEPPLARPDPIRNVARERAFGGVRSRPAPGIERAPLPRDGAATGRWRERQAERRGRSPDVPPAATSPVFGEGIQTPQTVTRPRRDVSIGSIAAEGIRNDRLRDRREAERWRNDWRRDRRYDWRSYRDRDRARFHLGLYIDPFGWRYRDWNIGWRLPSRYYSSRYWIRDPWLYRLPDVYGPYRWIRYHQDVLLIDLRDGRVVDRIRYFFW